MSAKISISGGNGRMGKTLIKEIIENENLELANSYCLPNEKEKGLDLGTLVGHEPIDKTLTDNLTSIFEDTDVIIDFTVPEASILHVEKAATYKIPIVIGTTGLIPMAVVRNFDRLGLLGHETTCQKIVAVETAKMIQTIL